MDGALSANRGKTSLFSLMETKCHVVSTYSVQCAVLYSVPVQFVIITLSHLYAPG